MATADMRKALELYLQAVEGGQPAAINDRGCELRMLVEDEQEEPYGSTEVPS
jgi:hypothetical protein